MKTGSEGIKLIKRFEGLSLTAYLCPANVLTIGYGHTAGVFSGQTITEKEADDLLKKDLATAENAVNAENLNINQNQFDALVSFTFNCGVGAFQRSTLLKKIKENPKNYEAIGVEFNRWVTANGQTLNALKLRREAEFNLYKKKIFRMALTRYRHRSSCGFNRDLF